MKITNKYNWNRRDFSYDHQCENCKNIETKCSGYDDENYYVNVQPNIKCKSCKESSISLGKTTTVDLKYQPHQTI